MMKKEKAIELKEPLCKNEHDDGCLRQCAFLNNSGGVGGTGPQLQNLDNDQNMCALPPLLISSNVMWLMMRRG